MADNDSSWHLSKSVPISLIVTIFIQTVTVVWFASELRFDVNVNKEDISSLTVREQAVEEVVNRQSVTLGRIDESLNSIKRSIERLEGGPNGYQRAR